MTVPAGGATATTDPADWRRSVGAEGLLREFNEAGVIEAADVLVAQRLTGLAKETDESVALAVALVVRAVRGGSVCVDLTALPGQIGNPALPWPEAAAWTAAARPAWSFLLNCTMR